MLVLSRKQRESIIITPPGQLPITLVVVAILPGKVRLGIEASCDVQILRDNAVQKEPT